MFICPRNFITLLTIFFFLAVLFDFTLLPKEARADDVSISIEIISVCGDTVIEGDEQCEGLDLNLQTCESLGYQSGSLSCTDCFFDTSSCVPMPSTVTPGAGAGHRFIPPLSPKLTLKGKAYPKAVLNILQYGELITTFQVDSSGLFEKELTDLIEGTYIFGIWAEDSQGRKSSTVTYPITLLWGMVASINGIFIPPTISLEPAQVEKGDKIDISGEAFPGTEIHLFIPPTNLVKKTQTNFEGKWHYALDTSSFEEGSFQMKAKAFWEQEETLYSKPLSFFIGPFVPLPPEELPPLLVCQKADLTVDGKIDLVDFSILLYWWGAEEIAHPCADINADGKINIVDFSIMMYYWTG